MASEKKKVTFNDIAKYTNFSKTTISRYFNNPDSLTLKNQEIIAKALVDLNYQENKLAKVLANGKSEFVGILLPNLYLHYYSEMLNQLLATYEKFGLFLPAPEPKKQSENIFRNFFHIKLRGLLFSAILFLPKNCHLTIFLW